MTTNQDGPNIVGAAEPTLPAPDELAKRIIDRSIARLRELHDYAGRPAWDKIVAEEIASALSAFPADLPPQRPSVVPDEVVEAVALAILKSKINRSASGYRHLRTDFDTPFPGDYEDAIAALTTALPAIRAQAVAEIAADIRATMCDCSGKFIADAIEQGAHDQ